MSANVDTTVRTGSGLQQLLQGQEMGNWGPFWDKGKGADGEMGNSAPLGIRGKWGDGRMLPLCPTIYWRLLGGWATRCLGD